MNKDAELIHFMPLFEAGLQVSDKKKKRIKLRLIKAGRSQRGNFYSPEVLQEAAPLFKGVKMYVDHPPESKVNQPRSLRDWAATIVESEYIPAEQAIDATVGIRSDWLWKLIEAGNEEEWLSEIGSSINAAGPTRIGIVDGQRSNIVESIKLVRSVDFVPEASAGGHIQSVLEAKLHAQEDSLMEMTLAELMEAHPALLEQVQDATLEAARTDKEFLVGAMDSALQDEELSLPILEVVANSESAMTSMVEGIEFARKGELGYDFSDLEESLNETVAQLEKAQGTITALQESVQSGQNGQQIDLAAFENQVREDESNYWHKHYGNMQESATSGEDPELVHRVTLLESANEDLVTENNQLRGDFTSVISKATAMSMLKESGLPNAAASRLLPQMVSKTEAEMRLLIEDKRQEITELVGSDAIVKGGSGGQPSSTDLREAAQNRIDNLFDYDNLSESGKEKEKDAGAQPAQPAKTDLDHLM